MTLDVAQYLHHLDGMDMSEAEKAEFIRTLWLIAQCFVDDAYSSEAEREKGDVSQLKSGFAAANVIELSSFKQTPAGPANDDKALRANKEQTSRGRRS